MSVTGAAPNSSVVAYANGTDMVANRPWTHLADLLVEPSTRAGAPSPPDSSAAVVTLLDTADSVGYRALRWASAEIEAAVTCGGRYKPEDLRELLEVQVIPTAQGGDGVTTAYMVGRDLLVGLCCDLAYWWLVKRRKPGVKPKDVAGAEEALYKLQDLRTGERIFPFADTQDAGLPEVAALDSETNITQAATPMSVVASRFFGDRNR